MLRYDLKLCVDLLDLLICFVGEAIGERDYELRVFLREMTRQLPRNYLTVHIIGLVTEVRLKCDINRIGALNEEIH